MQDGQFNKVHWIQRIYPIALDCLLYTQLNPYKYIYVNMLSFVHFVTESVIIAYFCANELVLAPLNRGGRK